MAKLGTKHRDKISATQRRLRDHWTYGSPACGMGGRRDDRTSNRRAKSNRAVSVVANGLRGIAGLFR